MDYPAGIKPHGAGLRIRIFRAGEVAHQETLKGDCGTRHLKAAIKRRQELQSLLLHGLSITQESILSFKDAAQEYMNLLDAKHSTVTSYRNIIKRYWLPKFEKLPVTTISTKDIKIALASFDVSPKTKKNLLIPLRGVLDHAEVNPNPCNAVKIKQRQKEQVKRYSPEERDKLLSQLDGDIKAYFVLMFGCGLRPGEVLGLKWCDYKDGHLNIEKQITRRRLEPSTKTGYRRRVFVPQWVRPHLNLESRFTSEWIFANAKGNHHQDTDRFNEAWAEAHTRAKVRYRIPYTCRHTRAAELLSAGVLPPAAAAQLGHSVEMFFRTYSEWIEDYSQQDQVFDTPYIKA